MQGKEALLISWPIGTYDPTRAATSGAFDELAVDDDDEAAVEQTTSTLGSPLRGTLGEAHGSY